MQVTFKLYPGQMLKLGMALANRHLSLVRQNTTDYVHDVIGGGYISCGARVATKTTPLTIDTNRSLVSFEGSRKTFQSYLNLFQNLDTPLWKLQVISYDNDGQNWLKPWETQDQHVEERALSHQIVFSLRDSFNEKSPEKHVCVDTKVIAKRLNIEKLVPLVEADDWKKIQASWDKGQIDLAKAIVSYDKATARAYEKILSNLEALKTLPLETSEERATCDMAIDLAISTTLELPKGGELAERVSAETGIANRHIWASRQKNHPALTTEAGISVKRTGDKGVIVSIENLPVNQAAFAKVIAANPGDTSDLRDLGTFDPAAQGQSYSLDIQAALMQAPAVAEDGLVTKPTVSGTLNLNPSAILNSNDSYAKIPEEELVFLHAGMQVRMETPQGIQGSTNSETVGSNPKTKA